MIRRSTLSGARRAILALTCLGLACKLLTPIGYMPASIAEGGPLTFCPGASVADLLRHHDPHHQHDGHGHGKGKGQLEWDHCPYGVLAKGAPLSITWESTIAHCDVPVVSVPSIGIATDRTTRSFHARAPPQTLA